jgi:hypothetical protein
MKSVGQKDICTPMFIATLFAMAINGNNLSVYHLMKE